MNAQGSAYKYLEAYLTHIRAKGRYAFTLDEAKQYFKVSDKALRVKGTLGALPLTIRHSPSIIHHYSLVPKRESCG